MGSRPRLNHLGVVDIAASLVVTTPGAAQPCVAVHTFPMAIVCLDSADELYITWDPSAFSANGGNEMGLLRGEGFCGLIAVPGKGLGVCSVHWPPQ